MKTPPSPAPPPLDAPDGTSIDTTDEWPVLRCQCGNTANGRYMWIMGHADAATTLHHLLGALDLACYATCCKRVSR